MIAAFAIALAAHFTPCDTSTGEQLILEQVHTDFGYVAVNAQDVQAAIAEGEAAKDAAETVLLLPNVAFAIVEEGCTDAVAHPPLQDLIVHTWPFPHGSRRQGPRPPTNVLRHEIGHDLFARYVIPKTRDNQYSTDAPDWLDEMAAIAFEGEEQQRNRRQMARIDADGAGLLPLPRLLTMTHPEYGGRISVPEGQTFVVASPASQDTLPFYSTVFAFHEFLTERTGSKSIVAELASAFREGEALDRWILQRIGSDHVGTLEELDADFLIWFERDPRYAQNAAPSRD